MSEISNKKNIHSNFKDFSTNLEVRISEINYGGHLGHVQFLFLIHEARVKFLKNMSHNFSEKNFFGHGLILKNLSFELKNQAFHGDEIMIKVSLEKPLQAKLNFLYEAFNVTRNNVLGKAVTTLAFYDYEKNKVMKPPKKLIDLFD